MLDDPAICNQTFGAFSRLEILMNTIMWVEVGALGYKVMILTLMHGIEIETLHDIG